MFSLKIERVNRDHNYFVCLFLDDARDLFDAVMPSLPILFVGKIVPAKLASVLGGLARPLRYGITNFSLAGATFARLLASMVGKSDCLQFFSLSLRNALTQSDIAPPGFGIKANSIT